MEKSEIEYLKDMLQDSSDYTVYKMYVAIKPFAKGKKYPITKSYYHMCEKLFQNVHDDSCIHRLLNSEDLTTLWSNTRYAHYFDIHKDSSGAFTRYFHFEQKYGYKFALNDPLKYGKEEKDIMIRNVLSKMYLCYQYYCMPDGNQNNHFVFRHFAYYRDLILKEIEPDRPFVLCSITSPNCASTYTAALAQYYILENGKVFLKKLQDNLRNDLKKYNVKCSLMNQRKAL